MIDKFLPNNKNSIQKAQVISISKKTVKFGDDVYQFRNVTGFGITEMETDGIPIILIVMMLLMGIFILLYADNQNHFWGNVTIFLSICGIFYNALRPKIYGLKLYLNSGDGKVFITKDARFLKNIVLALYSFMESEEEGTYIVNIHDKSIIVEGSVGGNVNTGEIQGNISSHVGRDVSRKQDLY